MKLTELIDVANTAEWRRLKAEEFPNDKRNLEAAECLESLELEALNGSEIHHRLETLFDRDGLKFCEVVNEQLRLIGFQTFPSTARELCELIETVIER